MTFLQWLLGMIEVELTSADPAGFLDQASREGISVYGTREESVLTWRFWILRGDLRGLSALAEAKGSKLDIVGRKGFYWWALGMLKRPVLVLGLAALVALVLWLPSRVLFVTVEGNTAVPAKLILEKAAESGIDFGASRREVRSEKVKNALLAAVPELEWAGVNTKGCTAVITVRERAENQQSPQGASVSRIVASRDGVITSCTSTAGSAQCAVGQAVKAGQTLISGYTDCGITILATRAKGEIYADTTYDLTAFSPGEYTVRGLESASVKKYSLIIGKKRINFDKDSGILDATCAKIYQEYCLTLPGGFRLPVTLVVEEWTVYETATEPAGDAETEALLSDFARNYLLGQMAAGQILSGTESAVRAGEIYVLLGSYACNEMIGRERSEEIIHGKTD